MNVENIDSREKNLAENSFSTASDLSEAGSFIDFPENVEGITILDIGSGASTTILELRLRGSNAIGIDLRYGRLKGLKTSVDRALTNQYRITRPEKLSELSGSQRESAELQIVREKEYIKVTKARMRTFFDALANREIQAVAGIAGALPFKDESVDFAFSLQCITRFVIRDRKLFLRTVEEALRVLKPGGQLQLQPWIDLNSGFGPEEKQTAGILIDELKQQDILYLIEPNRNPKLAPRLRITKPF